MLQYSLGEGGLPQYRQWLDALGKGGEYRGGLPALGDPAVGGFSPERNPTGKLHDPGENSVALPVGTPMVQSP